MTRLLGKNKIFRLTLFGILTGAITMISLLATPSSASAASCQNLYPPGGPACGHGFFFNGTDNFGTDVWVGGVNPATNSAPALINEVRSKMNCNGAGVMVNATDSYATGSAFIILTMLGYPGGTNKNVACQQANRWAGLVNSYAAAGLINFNLNASFIGNTYFQNSAGTRDDAWEDPSSKTWGGTATMISFFKPDKSGVLYSIKRSCANPVGILQALQPLNPPSGNLNPPTPPPPAPGVNPGNDLVNSHCGAATGHATYSNATGVIVPLIITYTINGATTTVAAGTDPANGGFFYNATPASVRTSLSPISVHAYAKDLDPTKPNLELAGSPMTLGPCIVPAPTCGGFTTSPTIIEKNTPYVVTATVDYGNSAALDQVIIQEPGAYFYMDIHPPTGPASLNNSPLAPPYPANPKLTRAGAVLTLTLNQPATGGTGTYIINWGINRGGSVSDPGMINCGGAGPAPPRASFDVVDIPIFRVARGDASAGAGMAIGGTDCAAGPTPQNTKASIVGWNKGGSGAFGGAGTQYAALAFNHLQDFATAQGSAAPPAARPDGLAFANTADAGISVGTGIFGGQFDGTACIPDYYKNAKGVLNGNQTIGGQLVLNNLPAVPSHKTIYVNGDVYITGNIIFTGSITGYASASEIPSFNIVATGNIFIDKSVTQLDGLYVAQKNIYTCATGFAALPLDSALYNTCKQSLTVNGALIAKQIRLMRTVGSLSSGGTAEVFNFTPEIWLGLANDSSLSSGSSSTKYDAITSLPPVL